MSAEPSAPLKLFACAISGCGNRVEKRGDVCTESSGGTVRVAEGSSPEAKAAYRAGLCQTCRAVPYAAGMTRCYGCQAEYLKQLTEGTA